MGRRWKIFIIAVGVIIVLITVNLIYHRPIDIEFTVEMTEMNDGTTATLIVDIQRYNYFFKPNGLKGTLTLDGVTYNYDEEEATNQNIIDNIRNKFAGDKNTHISQTETSMRTKSGIDHYSMTLLDGKIYLYDQGFTPNDFGGKSSYSKREFVADYDNISNDSYKKLFGASNR